MHAAERWFGSAFDLLHPQLQALHRHGGTLSGMVRIETPQGTRGLLGRRLARAMGIPLDRAERPFAVCIGHDAASMTWARDFGDAHRMTSVFEPVGSYPDGHWRERIGSLTLRLGVGIVDGGWQWHARGARVAGLPLPRWVLPRTRARKAIDAEGRYRFEVAIALPVFGTVLRYAGTLQARADAQAG